MDNTFRAEFGLLILVFSFVYIIRITYNFSLYSNKYRANVTSKRILYSIIIVKSLYEISNKRKRKSDFSNAGRIEEKK